MGQRMAKGARVQGGARYLRISCPDVLAEKSGLVIGLVQGLYT